MGPCSTSSCRARVLLETQYHPYISTCFSGNSVYMNEALMVLAVQPVSGKDVCIIYILASS